MFNLNKEKISSIVVDTLHNSDGGDLFLEHHKSETLTLENGILRHCDFNVRQGFGLRSFCDDQTIFFHSSDISEEAISQASKMVKSTNKGIDKIDIKQQKPHTIYPQVDPTTELEFQEKLSLLQKINAYVNEACPQVKKSIVTLSGSVQEVEIVKANGVIVSDIRPLVRLNISLIVQKDGKTEQGYAGRGGRNHYKEHLHNWRSLADEAIKQALINLEAQPTPAGEMTVVLGNGWPGVLLHEAIGHGLEGDFNRKETSAFSDLIGKRVASKGIIVVLSGSPWFSMGFCGSLLFSVVLCSSQWFFVVLSGSL